jgi:hypothetical protein
VPPKERKRDIYNNVEIYGKGGRERENRRDGDEVKIDVLVLQGEY